MLNQPEGWSWSIQPEELMKKAKRIRSKVFTLKPTVELNNEAWELEKQANLIKHKHEVDIDQTLSRGIANLEKRIQRFKDCRNIMSHILGDELNAVSYYPIVDNSSARDVTLNNALGLEWNTGNDGEVSYLEVEIDHQNIVKIRCGTKYIGYHSSRNNGKHESNAMTIEEALQYHLPGWFQEILKLLIVRYNLPE